MSVETNTITSGDSTLVVVDDGLRVGGDIVISGDIIPDTSNVYILGSATNQWADLYAANATIYMKFVTPPVPLANLTAVAGARAFVSDGNLAAVGNFGAQIGNAGSNVVPVYSDGANWYIG